jgi:hypothetical protein
LNYVLIAQQIVLRPPPAPSPERMALSLFEAKIVK